MKIFREFQQAEALEATAHRKREQREVEYRWAMGLGPKESESSTSSEEGWVSDDSFS